ncbi:unnamed protein product [Vicia faba]|uniref:AB hydrolase-1 domain-containing protein n=1 Tax=Vicia faba TaxID=3906 RepID=A0AAV0YCC3_VICFA|nr:unnamed protein product [Vicia faba]
MLVCGAKCVSHSPHPPPFQSRCSNRPAVILPGLGNNSGDYQKLEATLNNKYGVSTVVAKVSRLDWFRNAAGLIDPNYWRGTLQPSPVLDWYLKRVHDAVQEAIDLAPPASTLSLIGHSAGGWLARLYMEQFGVSNISLLLTLAPKGVPGVIDQTRGLLDYVEQYCSKPVYTPELKYVCIAGRYIEGAPLFANSNPTLEPLIPTTVTEAATATTSSPNITLRARFVGQGYKQVCGKADVWGDGVVPQLSAQLEGALNISLDGVYHSPLGSDDATRPWYKVENLLENPYEVLMTTTILKVGENNFQLVEDGNLTSSSIELLCRSLHPIQAVTYNPCAEANIEI